MDDTERLTNKQEQYVRNLVSGMDSRSAARESGYSDSYSKVAGSRLMKNLSVAQAIESIRTEARTTAVYDLVAAVKEIDAQIKGALEAKSPNHMAAAKLLEMKLKAYGLLIDRFQEVPLDLTGALQRDEARVINTIDMTPNGASSSVKPLPLPAKKAIRWAAEIAGDPAAEDPAAGPADSESGRQVKKAEMES
jgi:hypothetical protein